MNLSPLVKLNVACAMLSLFTASAFIASNYLLLVLNQIGITIVLWVRLIKPRLKMSEVNSAHISRIVAPTFAFITTLSIGSPYSEKYKWYIFLFSIVVLVGLYKLLKEKQNTWKDN